MNRFATLVVLCASAAFTVLGSGMGGVTVSPGGWSHLSARFFATNAAQNLSVTLRYTDAFTVDPGAKGTCLFQIR